MIDNTIRYNISMVINFIDFRAAFDSVTRDYIWSAMANYGFPVKYISIFKAFYTQTLSAVRVGDTLSNWFEVKSGTGQGDIQAPSIFNVVLNWVLERAISAKTVSDGYTLQHRLSSRYTAKTVTDADYADDIAAIDNTPAGLQETTSLMHNLVKKPAFR